MRFTGSVTGAAPLQAQLSMPAGSMASLCSIHAETEGASGSVSRVVVSRPSTVGTGTMGNVNVRGGVSGATPVGTFLTSFSSAPSTPTVSTGTSLLPIRISWLVNVEDGIVVGGQGALAAALVYAGTSGGASWSADITWEEL